MVGKSSVYKQGKQGKLVANITTTYGARVGSLEYTCNEEGDSANCYTYELPIEPRDGNNRGKGKTKECFSLMAGTQELKFRRMGQMGYRIIIFGCVHTYYCRPNLHPFLCLKILILTAV